MMIRIIVFMAALGVAACADRDEIAEGKRTYQGKPDTPAWADGDPAAWEARINQRTVAQNEYRRINN